MISEQTKYQLAGFFHCGRQWQTFVPELFQFTKLHVIIITESVARHDCRWMHVTISVWVFSPLKLHQL